MSRHVQRDRYKIEGFGVCCIFFFRPLVRTLELLVEICSNGKEQIRLPPSAKFKNVPALHTKIYVLQLQ